MPVATTKQSVSQNDPLLSSKLQTILDTEYQYTKSKSDSIQNAARMSHRSAELNDNFKKRYSKYTLIVILLIVAVVGHLSIIALAKAFPVFPSLVFDMLSIVLILSCVIYAIYIFIEITNRSQMDYDELYIPTTIELENNPMTPASFQSEYEKGQLSSFLKSTNYAQSDTNECIGAECCPDGFLYNSAVNKCVWNASSSPAQR